MRTRIRYHRAPLHGELLSIQCDTISAQRQNHPAPGTSFPLLVLKRLVALVVFIMKSVSYRWHERSTGMHHAHRASAFSCVIDTFTARIRDSLHHQI